MRYIELSAKILESLERAGISSARLDTELIIAHVVGRDRSWLVAHGQDEVDPKISREAQKLARSRAKRLPLSYVIGEREFFGLKIAVDERVLTPRTETETIASEVIKSAPRGGRLLDIGTGSGAVAVAIAKHRPDLSIYASDISTEALELARQNAQTILGSRHKLKFIRSDLFAEIATKFDVIAANLPYVSDDSRDNVMPEVAHEPAVALFGGAAGLEMYQKFFNQLPSYLNPYGQVYTESDPWQHDSLKSMAARVGLKPIFEDYFILGFEKA